jgi:bacteriophage N4 adsorption protein B
VPYHALYAAAFTILAGLLLLSALDDMAPLLICLFHWKVRGERTVRKKSTVREKKRRIPQHHQTEAERRHTSPQTGTQRRIAIFVPCWKESHVIASMVRHNLASIRYRYFDFFLGAYQNDEETLKAVRELERTCRNVHAAIVPHDGPTSKADCLNWAFQSLLSFEETEGTRFDAVMVHDAEDLIHPDSLQLIHQKLNEYDTVQVPVLPLPTGIAELTHGIYCDEFAEFQTIDMPARGFSGSFLPSNGVGTGYARAVLERLAEKNGNRVFEPASLTEDYESGVRIYQLGFRQLFAKLERVNGEFLSTREYFPRTFHSAVRQRTRWVTGICLQSWERLGWHESGITLYWFWRDRKALFTNPTGLLVTLLTIVSLGDLAVARLTEAPWHFAIAQPLTQWLCWANLTAQAIRTAVRMLCVGRVYGWRFSTGVPIRAFYESIINGIATFHAVRTYVMARREGRPLVWLKTEHFYPSRASLESLWKGLDEVLVGSGYLDAETLAMAYRMKAADADLGQFLVANRLLSEEDYCEAVSLCSGVSGRPIYVGAEHVNLRTARSLPVRLQRKHRVTPVYIEAGQLYLATPYAPPPSLIDEIQRHTRLQVQFRMVTPSNYAELRSTLFGESDDELVMVSRPGEQRAIAAAV